MERSICYLAMNVILFLNTELQNSQRVQESRVKKHTGVAKQNNIIVQKRNAPGSQTD
jgi:hypothetical protein